MSFDGADFANKMVDAGKTAFGEDWAVAKEFAEAEFRTLGARLETIAEQTAKGMHPAVAKSLFRAQVRTAIQIIAGSTALTVLAVESAINAMLEIVKEALNTSIGFALL